MIKTNPSERQHEKSWVGQTVVHFFKYEDPEDDGTQLWWVMEEFFPWGTETFYNSTKSRTPSRDSQSVRGEGTTSVVVWACITDSGNGPLVFITGLAEQNREGIGIPCMTKSVT